MKFFVTSIVFIALGVTVIVLIIYSLYRNNTTSRIRTPTSAICNPNELLQAYIQDLPSQGECPNFENRYITSDTSSGIQLFDKSLRADESCCWFSNEVEQRTVIPNPFICNAVIPGFPNISIEQINQKPWSYRNGFITATNPSCGAGCVSVQRIRDDRYAVISAPTISSSSSQNVEVILGPSCSQLKDIRFNNRSAIIISEGQYVPVDGVPDIVQIICDIYNANRRFLPIPRVS